MPYESFREAEKSIKALGVIQGKSSEIMNQQLAWEIFSRFTAGSVIVFISFVGNTLAEVNSVISNEKQLKQSR